MDDLGLVEAVDHLGQGVVVAVPDTADRWLDPSFGKALGVLDGHVLRPAVAMMNEAAPMGRPAIMKCLLQGEHEVGMRRSAGPPTDDPPGVGIDDEGDVDKPRPGRDVGKVRHPQHVRRWRVEPAIDVIEQAWRRLVADGRAHRLGGGRDVREGRLHPPGRGGAARVRDREVFLLAGQSRLGLSLMILTGV